MVTHPPARPGRVERAGWVEEMHVPSRGGATCHERLTGRGTGATGYVGGEVLHQLSTGNAKHSISCLVRGPKVAGATKAYPDVRVVEGDLEDVDLVEKEARDADIVIHAASTRHEPSSKAIVKGLSSRSTPGYWIQMSGASLFSGDEIKNGRYGESGRKVYDNAKDIEEIQSVIKGSPGRVVDNLVLSQSPSAVRTALIVGPIIYGPGRGPGNTRTMQGPECAKYTLKSGHGFRLGGGKSVWSYIHVADVGSLVCLLVDAASKGTEGLWNDEGIYLPENGQISFGDLTSLIAKEAHRQGYIQNPDADTVVDPKDADQIMPHASVLLGTNAKLAESKARKDLKWQPKEGSLEDDVPGIVRREAESMGLKSAT